MFLCSLPVYKKKFLLKLPIKNLTKLQQKKFCYKPLMVTFRDLKGGGSVVEVRYYNNKSGGFLEL
jgi:hypothetical protein